jgi:fermentation-respiration switch protein FrsA (DUF1100 family)
MFDYRGYGKSTGQIKNKAQWYDDAEAMFASTQNQAKTRPIMLYGRSVGTSMAAYLAGRHKVDRVVLEASPYSFTEVAAATYPYLPIKWLFKYGFENADALSTNQNPTLLIHGTQDLVIPYSQFQKLTQR